MMMEAYSIFAKVYFYLKAFYLFTGYEDAHDHTLPIFAMCCFQIINFMNSFFHVVKFYSLGLFQDFLYYLQFNHRCYFLLFIGV